MKLNWKNPDDATRLRQLIRDESAAKQRDRYRVVLLAGEGLGEKPEMTREQVEVVAAAVSQARV